MTLSEWKRDNVTLELFEILQARIQEHTEALQASAGIDPRLDGFRSGLIMAYKDLTSGNLFEETNGN